MPILSTESLSSNPLDQSLSPADIQSLAHCRTRCNHQFRIQPTESESQREGERVRDSPRAMAHFRQVVKLNRLSGSTSLLSTGIATYSKYFCPVAQISHGKALSGDESS